MLLRAPFSCATNALPLRELRFGVQVALRFEGMATRRRSSKLPMSGDRKKLRASVDSAKQHEKSVIKEDVGMEEIRRNLDKIDSMNVRELRTLMKSIGLSTRGRKQDLISALKSFSFEGQTSKSANMEMPMPITIKSSVLKRDAAIQASQCTFQDSNAVLDIPVHKQKRTRRRMQPVEGALADSDSKVVLLDDVPIEPDTVVGTNQIQSAKQVYSGVQTIEKVSSQIGLVLDNNEPWTILAHKKPQKGWIPYNPKQMRPPPPKKDTKCLKLVSWNVNGLRALLKLNVFSALQLEEDFDVLCLQETKLKEKDVDEIKKNLIDGYDNSFWTCSVSKLGYSGTSIVSRIKPITVNYGLGIVDHDSEGRIVTVEFDTFYLISGYVPNSGEGLKRLAYRVENWDPALSNYMKELEKSKPVILTGDLNCAHEEIDIHDPTGNRRSAGFTNEERESFQKNFLSRGFVDTFRRQHPDVVAYTYWGYRHGGRRTNKGWRLDYFLASESIAEKVHDSYILPHFTGSDHCPIGLILQL
ncbi:hypothetical protein HPP92_016888 [Vanilla planifolia]|uniref:DNA-(apurinic or apyrimidinic site) endonuclease n=1 Tax=Vanilla planifolia TaxID=51239 RepID=A0A835QEX6_VANPL|nr:hypothetical protein HPP92_016888 [Vanilla planifolia]